MERGIKFRASIAEQVRHGHLHLDPQDVGPNPEGFLPDSRGGEAVLILEPGIDAAPWGARLSGFGYQVQVLDGGMAAGLPVASPESSFVRPGSVPFIVPRGQCEMGTPSESFH